MLQKLFIRNFALIDNLEIDFQPGFNVLTGETGAGKSIIIDAVDIAIGGQGLTDFIRSGEEKAVIEAFFDLKDNTKVRVLLEEYGYMPEKEEALILSRELVRSGKNTSRINGRQVNLSLYKEIARSLVDIYGQHHQQSLLDPLRHIDLLDEYGGDALAALKNRLGAIYEEYSIIQSQIRKMEASCQEQARMLDTYQYQLKEIEKCQLVPGEDESLAEQKQVLSHSEKISVLANSAYELLFEGGSHKAATDLISAAVSDVREITRIDPSIHELMEVLETSLYQIEEAARNLKMYLEKLETNPDKLEEIENRLDEIDRLKRKYGDSIKDILNYKEQIAASLDEITNYDDSLRHKKTALEEIGVEYNQLANALTMARKQAATGLIDNITAELKELNMPHVTFDVKNVPKTNVSASGMDDIEFLISPNQGEPLKPLSRIVSGGEVSRIMLAFKSVLTKIDDIPTLIFDEVDAGVGGNALHAVAKKLAVIGRENQVICVTHSPHIAGHALTHFNVSKTTVLDRTVTSVQQLTTEERIAEIARMLSGNKVTPVIIEHAEEILRLKDELL